MKTSSRLGLLSATALLALSAGLPTSAVADTTANVDIDNDNAPLTIITLVNTASITSPIIVGLQSIFGAGTGVSVVDGSNVIDDNVVGDGAVVNTDLNVISTRTRGNNFDNSVGLANFDGAIILTGQQTVPDGAAVTNLQATTNNNLILNVMLGDGQGVTGTTNLNGVEAAVSFNTNFSTIDTELPANLVPGTQGSYLSEFTVIGPDTAGFFPTDVDQTANFNVASVQVNFGFANGNAADLTAASVDDTVIAMAYRFDPTLGDPDTLTGSSFQLNGNTVNSQTQGNAADNSVFLNADGAQSFAGTAVVSSTQSSSDSTAPTGAFTGISASTEDTTIVGALAAEADQSPVSTSYGLPDILSVVGVSFAVDGNTIASGTIINSARNEVALAGDLTIAGGDSTTTYSTGVGSAPVGAGNLNVTADFAAVSNQTAAGTAQLQTSEAFTEAALVLLAIEDVDGTSTLSLADNTIASSATGQSANNVIRNNNNGVTDPTQLIDEGSTSVIGSFATGNRQYIIGENVSASIFESAFVAALGTADDGGDAFGGIAGSSLTVGDGDLSDGVAEGNVFQASATANSASGRIDLSGLTLDVSGDLAGAEINSEHFGDVTTPRSVQNADAGVMLGNWQFADGIAGLQGVSALVENADILALANFDQGDVGNQEANEVTNAIIKVDGNGAIASATLNGYSATANLSADTSLAGSVAALSFQASSFAGDGAHVVDATVTDSEISTLLGLNGTATTMAVTTDGNDVLALANGNSSAQTINAVAGTTLDADAVENGGTNAFLMSVATATVDSIRTDLEARAGYLAVSDQVLRAAQVEAEVSDFEINLLLAGVDDGPAVSLNASVLSLSGNDLVAQVLGNNATNNVTLEASTSITGDDVLGAGVAASAGAISSQTTAQETALGDTFFEAEVSGNTISASVLETGTVTEIANLTLDVDGNRIQALTFANSATNDVSLTANTFTVDSTGEVPQAAVDPSADDLNMFVSNSSVYVINRQRNEGLDETVAGARVESFAETNEVLLNVNGGELGLTSDALSVAGNSIQATAAANVADNGIALDFATTGAAGAAILNRQGNSGNVGADNQDSLIEANVLGDPGAEHELTFSMNGNSITSSATGSSALNSVVAEANTLVGPNDAVTPLSGAYIGPSPLPSTSLIGFVRTDGVTLDANANAVANGNLTVLNTQRNFGTDPGTPNLINSETENAEIRLNVVGGEVATFNSTLTLNGNQVRSQGAANVATNSVTTATNAGGPSLATALNDQQVQNTAVTSAVTGLGTDGTIALNVDGDFTGGTIEVNNNVVAATAELNSATNTVTGLSSVGGLPSATIINHQSSQDSSATATNTGTTISQTTGLAGGTLTSSTVSVSGNQIGSAATINNATNTIGAPGQTFTRTSSF